MIKSFKHKGLKVFFETGSKAGIQPKHAVRLRLMLTMLDVASRVIMSPFVAGPCFVPAN